MGQKKSWSDDELIALIRAKKIASSTNIAGETAAKLSLRIKMIFDQSFPGNGRVASAIEDKVSVLVRTRRRLHDF